MFEVENTSSAEVDNGVPRVRSAIGNDGNEPFARLAHTISFQSPFFFDLGSGSLLKPEKHKEGRKVSERQCAACHGRRAVRAWVAAGIWPVCHTCFEELLAQTDDETRKINAPESEDLPAN